MKLREKILSNVEVTESGCWEWKGSTKSNGYGQVRNPATGKPVYCHRVVVGAPEGSVVLHSCDNRRCCNPSHLIVGTQKDNLQDMSRKGRGRRGSKLSDEDVLEIIKSTKSGSALAKSYGVSPATISMIRNGRTYGRLRR